jgi:hypothetical protein
MKRTMNVPSALVLVVFMAPYALQRPVLASVEVCNSAGVCGTGQQQLSTEVAKTIKQLRRYEELMPPTELRSRYVTAVTEQLRIGNAAAARQVALSGVQGGVFKDAWQRPESLFLPEIATTPFLDPAEYPVVATLEV